MLLLFKSGRDHMPRLRKAIFNKSVLFISSSVEEGLPFVPNALMKLLLESALARAQYHHPVRICHFIFEANHLHMIVIVDNPDDVKDFMERFKTESAHAVNRLLGRRKRTIWCEGYDSPNLLTVDDVVDKIAYLYTNPAKDNLEDSIDRYPGLSSWSRFTAKKHTKQCPWIRRDELFPLQSTMITLKQSEGLARKLKHRASITHSFEIHPNAWMEAFSIHEVKEQIEINNRITNQVKQREDEFRKTRLKEGKSVAGAERLALQPMDKHYIPSRHGRKMWCISSDIELRKAFIWTLKHLVGRAMEVFERWKVGDYSVQFPPGLYPPAMRKLIEPLAPVFSY